MFRDGKAEAIVARLVIDVPVKPGSEDGEGVALTLASSTRAGAEGVDVGTDVRDELMALPSAAVATTPDTAVSMAGKMSGKAFDPCVSNNSTSVVAAGMKDIDDDKSLLMKRDTKKKENQFLG